MDITRKQKQKEAYKKWWEKTGKYKQRTPEWKAKRKEWKEKNKDKIIQYRIKGRPVRNLRYKIRKEEDPLFKLKCKMRTRLSGIFKKLSLKKNVSTASLLGTSYEIVKQHIESKFVENMTWDNYGQWHIDHIIPLISAKSEKDLIKLCCYTNLQPLWAKDNIKKGHKIY